MDDCYPDCVCCFCNSYETTLTKRDTLDMLIIICRARIDEFKKQYERLFGKFIRVRGWPYTTPTLQESAVYSLINNLDLSDRPLTKLLKLQSILCRPTWNLRFDFDYIRAALKMLTIDEPMKLLWTKPLLTPNIVVEHLNSILNKTTYAFAKYYPLGDMSTCNFDVCSSCSRDLGNDTRCLQTQIRFIGCHFNITACNRYNEVHVYGHTSYNQVCSVIKVLNSRQFESLLLSGDVETNPGPVMSKFAISESGFRQYRAQSFFDHTHNVKLGIDDDVMSFITSLKANVSDTVSSAKQFVSTACKLFLASRNLNNKVNLAVIFVDLLITWDISMSVAQSAWQWIITHCSALFSHKYQAQSVVDNVCVRAITMLVTCLLAILGTTALPSQKLIDCVLKRSGDIGRATTGLKTLMDTVRGVFDSVYNTVYEFIFGVPPTDGALNDLLEDVHVWFREVDEHSALVSIDDIPVNYKICRDIERLYTTGLDFTKRLDTMKVSQQHREPFNRYWAVTQKLYDKVIVYGARRADPRTEPVVIRLFGDSGVGKSGLVFLLCQDICNEEGLAEEFWHEIYFRNVFQDFWDGYHGQMITVIDDFAQVQDSLGNINKEFLEVIKCKNVAKWPLYMSTLEQKARTNFTSRALVLTSNKLNYDTPSLTCKTALERRMDITAEVKVKKSYQKHGSSALNTAAAKNALDSDIYEFHIYRGNKATGEVLDYEQFSQRCIDEYRSSFSISNARIDILKARGKSMTAQYKEKQLNTRITNVKNNKVVYRAQQITDLTGDRCINPAIWLSARSATHNYVEKWLLDDRILTRPQIDYLLAKACEAESYNDFMFETYNYCTSQDIDLVMPIKTENDYNSLINFIYDNNLTLNKRRSNKTRFIDSIFYQMKETITSYYDSIRDNAGKAFLMFGGIMAGVLALYGAKKLFFDKPKEVSKSHTLPLNHLKVESRDEKRPRRVLKREMCSKAESRDERRPKRQKKLELAPEFLWKSTPCNCNMEAMLYQAREPYLNLVKRYLDDSAFQCKLDKGDESFCPICFIYSDHWMEDMCEVIRKNRLNCAKHSVEEQADNLIDELALNCHLYYAQALIDTNARELSVGPIASNLYRIATLTDDGWKDRVNGMFVRGTVMLTVRHVTEFLNEECCIYNAFVPDGLKFNKSDCQFINLTNNDGEFVDAMLMVLPLEVNLHRDLVKNFVTEYDINRFDNSPGNLIHLRKLKNKSKGQLVYGQFSLRNITAIEREEYWTIDNTGKDVAYVVRGGYEYAAETEEGDCGSPLVLSNQRLLGKIAGIHVAGASSSTDCSSLSTAVNQTMIKRGLSQVLEYRAQLKLELPYNGTPELPNGNFVPIGKYPKHLPSPSKTMYSHSPIHEKFSKFKPSTKRPACLKPKLVDGELVNPLMKGLSKCGVTSPTVDKKLLKRCVTALSSFYKRGREQTVRRPLTVEEIIRGRDDDPFITSINRKSSAGVPWCFDTSGKPGKQKWLGKDEDFIVDNPELMAKLQERLLKAKCGERVETIWADTLKDELRPNHKVDAAKTRVFSAGSMDYVLFMRQYYLPFFAHMMRQRIDNFSAVGINPFDVDWTRLAEKLRSKGIKVIAGDYENFDGTQLAIFLWAVLEIINNVEDDGEENKRIREVIFAEIVNSIHLHGNNLYAWTHSLTSGNPGTAIINTLYNVLVTMYVFCKCTGLPPTDFFKYVYMIAFGDDNALCISDLVIDRFNQVTMAEEFSKIGMKYTDETKTGNMVPFRTLEDINFLKRKFRKDPVLMRYVAPLELDTVLEMTMWVTNSNDPITLCKSNIDRAYHELAIHGPDVFDKWSKILDAIARETFKSPPILGDWLDYAGKDFGY